MKKRNFNSIIPRDDSLNGKRGVRPYDREAIYLWLYEHSDRRGIIIFKQRLVAEKLGIPYQTLCNIYNDFIKIGFIIKHGPSQFEVVFHPEEIDWGIEFKEKQFEIRKERLNKIEE